MKKNIFLLWLKIACFLFVIIPACSKSDDGYSGNNNSNNNNNNNSTTNSVSINSASFSPSSITVKVGTTVTWTNNDNAAHTVTADDGSFSSNDLAYYQTYSRTFNQSGTFKYHCIHHANMKGTVVVNQ